LEHPGSEKNIGRRGIICSKCGKALHAQHPTAQWAAQRAVRSPVKVPFEGYRISQLMVPWVDWTEVLISYEKNRPGQVLQRGARHLL
jgi:hypothetical protein